MRYLLIPIVSTAFAVAAMAATPEPASGPEGTRIAPSRTAQSEAPQDSTKLIAPRSSDSAARTQARSSDGPIISGEPSEPVPAVKRSRPLQPSLTREESPKARRNKVKRRRPERARDEAKAPAGPKPQARQEPLTPLAKKPETIDPPPMEQPAPDSGLAALGILVVERPSGLVVTGVVPGSEAAGLKLLPGDRLTHLGASPVRTLRETRSAVQGLTPGGRLSVVVARGLSTLMLTGEAPPVPAPFTRGPDQLSMQEMVLKHDRLEKVLALADKGFQQRMPQEFDIMAGQSIWVRFPTGIPAEARPGDVVEAEATTAVCTDQNLDFLSLPTGTRFWAKLMDPHGPSDTRNLRLFFFKMRPKGGSFYPISARITDVSGDQRFLRVTPGGTIVMAYNEAVPADLRVKITLLENVTLTEPPDYYQAGPGLWIQSRDDGPGFVVSHVIPERAAESAGLAAGDVLLKIGDMKASHLDFADGLSSLYGKQGTDVTIKVVPADQRAVKRPRSEMLTLKRGVRYVSDTPLPLPLPYAKWEREK